MRGWLLALMTWFGSASPAAPTSPSTATPRPGIALRPVAVEPLPPSETQTVYDIEVEDEHVFYAEGALVGNCEALGYMVLGMGEGGNLLFGAGRNIAAVQAKTEVRVFDRGKRASVFRRR